jgi:hypothetical protein
MPRWLLSFDEQYHTKAFPTTKFCDVRGEDSLVLFVVVDVHLDQRLRLIERGQALWVDSSSSHKTT